jgi:hypothetical protein
MSASLRVYLCLLASLALGWLVLQLRTTGAGWPEPDLLLAGAIALYIGSHGVRMLRLGLLTLDQRDKALALVCAHALTAFPSALIPFKIGEILRLAAFRHVFGQWGKALAVWLAERFGDVLVLAACILALYLLDVRLPESMRWVFLLFVLTSVFGLLGLFAVATTFVYLNRHLVLASHSTRGLRLLRASHAVRHLELNIQRSVEGRMSGLLLLSILTWALEIAAFALFAHRFADNAPDAGAMFASGLLASLPGGAAGAGAFGMIQTFALAALTLAFLAALLLALRLRIERP